MTAFQWSAYFDFDVDGFFDEVFPGKMTPQPDIFQENYSSPSQQNAAWPNAVENAEDIVKVFAYC